MCSLLALRPGAPYLGIFLIPEKDEEGRPPLLGARRIGHGGRILRVPAQAEGTIQIDVSRRAGSRKPTRRRVLTDRYAYPFILLDEKAEIVAAAAVHMRRDESHRRTGSPLDHPGAEVSGNSEDGTKPGGMMGG